MKKEMILLLLLLSSFAFVLAEQPCDLEIAVLNQDPYPAVPGEKVEVVFTVSNIDSDECGTIDFEVPESYPFLIAKGSESKFTIQSGTYTKDYNTQKTIPIDLIVDSEALDGDTPLEIRYKYSKSPTVNFISRTFDINIDDVRADFEIFVSDYDAASKEIKFEILNIGDSDIEAVTVEVPSQEGVRVYGANKENVGDLSSNEDTSAEFKADINSGKINLVLTYSDSIQVRRTVEKEVSFDSELFSATTEEKTTNYTLWAVVVLVIIELLTLVFWRRNKKKK